MKLISLITAALIMGIISPLILYPAGVPSVINYQGRLTDVSGKPVDDGIYFMKFKIYGSESDNDSLWSSGYLPIPVSSGLFTCLLGSVIPLPVSLFNVDTTRYLGISVGAEDPEITPRSRFSSAAYAIKSLFCDSAGYATSVADNIVTSLAIYDGTIQFSDLSQNGATQNQVIMWNGSAWVAGNVDQLVLQDNSVSQIKLKTSIGEVSSSSYTPANQLYTLPGGQYGFYPQIKGASAVNGRHMASILGTVGIDAFVPPTNYVTNICLRAEGTTIYAQQRYITSSGKDYWIFLLQDKSTKEVVSGYVAPDHPCYGSGGSEIDIPHPFGSYDSNTQEIVLIDNCILSELKSKVGSRRSLLTIINEDYEIDLDSRPIYDTREIIEIDEYGDKGGEIIRRIKTPEWAKILIQKDEIFLRRRLVKELPSCITFRQLKPKNEPKAAYAYNPLHNGAK